MSGTYRRSLSLAAALAAAAIAALPASARPPAHSTSSGTDVVVYEPCGLVEVAPWTLHRTRYFDQEGNVTRTMLRFAFDGVITNPATGETWRDLSRNIVVLDGDGGSVSGVGFNLRLPGEGVLFLDVGRLVFDADGETVFSSAKFFGLEETSAALCEALT